MHKHTCLAHLVCVPDSLCPPAANAVLSQGTTFTDFAKAGKPLGEKVWMESLVKGLQALGHW